MSLEQIVVLALIQGITEFLPISSSGHLILVPAITGWADQGVVTDMVTNLGTLAAVIIYFWRDVVHMFWGAIDLVRRRTSQNADLAFHVLIGTIPIIVVGLLLKLTHLDDHIRSATLVAVNAIVFGILLYAADTYGLLRRTIVDMNWKSSPHHRRRPGPVAQPRHQPLRRHHDRRPRPWLSRGPEAARFSFLLSIPANGAASLLIIGDAAGKRSNPFQAR